MAMTNAEKQAAWRKRRQDELERLRAQQQPQPQQAQPTGSLRASLSNAPYTIDAHTGDDDLPVITIVATLTVTGATFKSPAEAWAEAQDGYVTINGETFSIPVKDAKSFVVVIAPELPEAEQYVNEIIIQRSIDTAARDTTRRSEAAKRGAAWRKSKLAGG